MGAGAVGGYFGARLAAAGQNVAFIARGSHLESMRREGLRVKSIQGNLCIRSLFTSSSEEVGARDLILLCVKSYDTEEAVKTLEPLMGEKTVVLSLQNGVDNPEKIAKLWGADRTLAGVADIAVRVPEPGTIEHTASGRIFLGPLQPSGRESAGNVKAVFVGAKIPCEVSPDIQTTLWKKLAWNAPFCALSCLLRMTVGEIVASESLRSLITSCIEEVRDAAQYHGVELPSSTAEETLGISRFSHSLGDVKPSMLQDLEAGKPLEYEALNGIIVKLLHGAGKRAPINEIFYTALKDKR
jgi:2-dehydropantoate 2-reductase